MRSWGCGQVVHWRLPVRFALGRTLGGVHRQLLQRGLALPPVLRSGVAQRWASGRDVWRLLARPSGMRSQMVLGALLHGENVLVHCFRGRHRSGAFVIFCLALIMGWDLETARAEYFRRRPDFTPKDRAIVDKALMHKGGLQWMLEDMQGQDLCQHAVKVLVNLSRVPGLRGFEDGLIPFDACPSLPPTPANTVAPKARPHKRPRTPEGSEGHAAPPAAQAEEPTPKEKAMPDKKRRTSEASSSTGFPPSSSSVPHPLQTVVQ